MGWLGRESGCDPKEATKRVEINQREEEITKIKEEMSKQIYERVKEGTDSRNFIERNTNICESDKEEIVFDSIKELYS